MNTLMRYGYSTINRCVGPLEQGEYMKFEDVDALLRQREERIERLEARLEIDCEYNMANERIEIDPSMRDQVPDGIACRDETIKGLDARLKEREEALDLVRATCDNKDWYMARQGDSFEALRQHGIALEAQLVSMTAEQDRLVKCAYMGPLRDCPTHGESAQLKELQQQLAASQARIERLRLGLSYLSELGNGLQEFNFYAKNVRIQDDHAIAPTERPPA